MQRIDLSAIFDLGQKMAELQMMAAAMCAAEVAEREALGVAEYESWTFESKAGH